MRRRRQKNSLLMRIIMISVLVHILLLPVLAHYGAFKKIQEHFVETQLVNLPPPKQEQVKPEVKKIAHAPHKVAAKGPKRAAPTSQHAHPAAQRTAMNHPPVVAATGNGEGNGDGIEANGIGKAGQLPTEEKKPQTQTNAATTPTETKPAVKPEEPKPVETPKPMPEKAPAPPPPMPEPPKAPVFTSAAVRDAPQPNIPDDLRALALDKTAVAEFTVEPDGSVSDVQITQSTGNDELDRIARDTAKQYKFKPALRDGQPVASHVRLHIEFQVS